MMLLQLLLVILNIEGVGNISKIHLVLPDPHATAGYDNRRADWVGQLMLDLKPDVFVNLGDQFDLASLSGYDKGKSSFHGKAYKKDLDAGLEFTERLFAPIRRAKKKRPRTIFLEGNHEERQRRLLDLQPELDGTISFSDFDLNKEYEDIIRYKGNTPGTIVVDGITYAHYLVTGVSGRGVSGEHPGYSLLTKHFSSVTCGHVHTFDYSIRTDAHGRRLHGLVAGVYQEHDSDWAGEINRLWSRGVVIKKEVENGDYDLTWVSIKQLEKAYG